MQVEVRIKDDWSIKRQPAIIGKSFKIGSWEFVWWGFSQIHKWRWHRSHIDLGALSVYGFRYNHWFWRIIANLPIFRLLRWNYHRRFKGDWFKKYEEQLKGGNV